MAGYGYTGRGYIPHERSRLGTRSKPWDTTYNRVETQSDGWGKTGFASNNEDYQDHVCRPVVIDAQGNKRPIIACTPNHSMDGINNGWSRPVNPSYDPPPKDFEYTSKVQTEASRPSKTGLVRSMFWRKTSNSNGHGGTTGYNGYSDNGTSGWNRPSGNTIRQPHSDGYFGRYETVPDGKQEPTMITEGGWARPSRLGWATPASGDSSLTEVTNDIGTSIDYLKEATKTPPVTMGPIRRFTVPAPTVPKAESFSPTIDSREPQWRYGGLSATPQAIETAGTYSSTIDSREAARKYNGQIM